MFVSLDCAKLLEELTRTDPDTLVDRARDLATRRAALDAEEAELLATVEELRVGGIDWFRDPGAWLRAGTGIRAVDDAGHEVPWDGKTVGELQLRGPWVIAAYYNDERSADAFADGWFTTADLGHLDADGRLLVYGRVDDVAVSGGVNVPLAAVDAVVASHPGVAQVAAVALPDPEWGQRVVAVVVPRDPADPPTLGSVRAHVQRHAPAAHAPKELVVLHALPTLPGGKIDRRALTVRLLETTTN